MIVGVGIDMMQISRVEEAMQKPAFFNRCFTDYEREYVNGKGRAAAQSAAGLFAAKEAAVKALGVGIAGAGGLGCVQFTHTKQGMPKLTFTGKAAQQMCALGGTDAHVSISHQGDMAIAMVVLEGEK